MNEHDNLTEEEIISYRSALNEAYPTPKSDIHGNVMKAIRAERLAQKKKARRAAFVKWGSVAACLAVVCLIGWRVLPEADRFAPMAAKNDSAEGFNLNKAYDLAPCDADSVEQEQEAANYSANVEDVSDYTVAGEDLNRYGISDDSVIQNPGKYDGETTSSYVGTVLPNSSVNSEDVKDPAETEETSDVEILAEDNETVAVSK